MEIPHEVQPDILEVIVTPDRDDVGIGHDATSEPDRVIDLDAPREQSVESLPANIMPEPGIPQEAAKETEPEASAEPVVTSLTQELMSLETPKGLEKLSMFSELSESGLKIFALHIGLLKNPGIEIPELIRSKVVGIVWTRVVDPALGLDMRHQRQQKAATLTVSDRIIINRLITPPGIEPASFERLQADIAKGKLYKGLPDLTAENLREKVQDIFEHKLPLLLSELPTRQQHTL